MDYTECGIMATSACFHSRYRKDNGGCIVSLCFHCKRWYAFTTDAQCEGACRMYHRLVPGLDSFYRFAASTKQRSLRSGQGGSLEGAQLRRNGWKQNRYCNNAKDGSETQVLRRRVEAELLEKETVPSHEVTERTAQSGMIGRLARS